MSDDAAGPIEGLEPEAIRAARERIAGRIHRTPLSSATLLGRRAGVRLLLKCENLQKTGSFKVRGVLNRLLQLDEEERERGVITISAGNHAQALAWGARDAGIDCKVVMPASAPRTKVAASEGYGARVVLHGDVFEAFEKALELAEAEGRTFVHPFDDPRIVAGQGTVGLEILEEAGAAGDVADASRAVADPAGAGTAWPPLEAVVVPVGGGGLVSGIAAAVKAASGSGDGVRVYGVEPEGAAAMRRSLEAGEPVRLERVETIADGLASPMAGELTFRAVRRYVDDVVTVTDARIADAVGQILSWTKLLAEPAGAAGVAALLAGEIPVSEGAGVVCVLSGGNVDLSRLTEIL